MLNTGWSAVPVFGGGGLQHSVQESDGDWLSRLHGHVLRLHLGREYPRVPHLLAEQAWQP